MLRIDVSSLRHSELHSLLANAKARGNDTLVEQLEAELAARATGRAPVGEPDPEPPFESDDVLPIDVGPPAFDLPFERPAFERRRSRRAPLGLIAAGVLAAGGAVAWGLAGAPGLPRAESRAAASAAAPPAPAPRAMTVRAAVAPPAPAAERGPEPPAPAPTPVLAAAEAEPSRARPTRLDPCAKPPSPADRTLCNDLGLNLLDNEMREAYGRAMEAGADPIALRDSQAQWRRARDPVADPAALAELYDRRIAELKAAATAPPP